MKIQICEIGKYAKKIYFLNVDSVCSEGQDLLTFQCPSKIRDYPSHSTSQYILNHCELCCLGGTLRFRAQVNVGLLEALDYAVVVVSDDGGKPLAFETKKKTRKFAHCHQTTPTKPTIL